MLEIGTGSGCLSITLARLYPHWQIHACDISLPAIRVARQNAWRHRQYAVRFHRADLFDERFLSNDVFDLIVSNPPYISIDELDTCDRRIFHEPSIALFARPPLKFYTKIIERAKQQWLKPGGYLLFECSPFNVEHVRRLFIEQSDSFDRIEIDYDTNELPRVIIARKTYKQEQK
jgi:release factor glutamine methyltransferase